MNFWGQLRIRFRFYRPHKSAKKILMFRDWDVYKNVLIKDHINYSIFFAKSHLILQLGIVYIY